MAKAKEAATEPKARGRAPNPDAQNGVSPPAAKTASAAVWAACNKSASKNNGVPVPKDVVEAVLAKNPDMNVSTIKTQIARYRQFHGMVTARG